MDLNKFAGMTACIVVMLLLAASVLMPTINNATHTTTTIENPSASAHILRYEYIEDASDYDIDFWIEDSSMRVGTYGGDYQGQGLGKRILWSSDAAMIVCYGEDGYVLVAENGDSVVKYGLGNSGNITSAGGTITVTDSTDTAVYTDNAFEWQYVPDSNGKFAEFGGAGSTTQVTVKDFPAATWGGFAGVYAYNEINSLNYDALEPTYSLSGGVFTPGPWQLADAEENAIGSACVSADFTAYTASTVPTPTYTDGEWGFDLSGSNAKIVSYSGAGGNIVIPTTVSNGGTTYTVTEIGKGSADFESVFDNSSITASTLTIPEGITKINKSAFDQCSNLTGTLTIPSTVTTIGEGAFRGCSGFTGDLVIPDSVTSLGQYAFASATGMTGSLTLSDSLTTIAEDAFYKDNFTGELVVPEGVTSVAYEGFYQCKFTELTLPSTLTSVATRGFSLMEITGDLIIPESLTTIAASSFYSFGQTNGAGVLVIPATVTDVKNAFANSNFEGVVLIGAPTILSGAFNSATIGGVLNLGGADISGVSGLSTVDVQDEITNLGYIAPVSYSETTAREGAIYDLMAVIPILIIAAILLSVATMIITRRD